MAKQSLPEGYGRSVVNGNEIITAPTQKAAANPMAKVPSMESLTGTDAIDQDQYSKDLYESRLDEEELSFASEEQAKGIYRINGFKEEDLANQYKSLMKQYGSNPLGQQAINALISEEDDGSDEGLRYLKESIKYGRENMK